MKLLLLQLFMFTTCIYDAHGIPCTTPSGASGRCLPLHKCRALTTTRKHSIESLTLQDYLTLNNPLCIENKRRHVTNPNVVCCPNNHSTPKPVTPSKCFTPVGQLGTCSNLYSCPAFTSFVHEPVTYDSLAYFESSRCEGPERYSVCCGPSALTINLPVAPSSQSRPSYPLKTSSQISSSYLPQTSTQSSLLYQSEPLYQPSTSHQSISSYKSQPTNNVCTASALPPDPQSKCCGLHSGSGDRIIGGSATEIDQYPWLVLIEYTEYDKIELKCGGSLISGRYVLTASHCVAGYVLEVATPVSVRVGEYDISHPGPDCIEVPGGGEDCTTGPLTIPIEETIPHESYDTKGEDRRHDIALLRLSKTAPYSDFVRPICLPTSDLTLNPPYNLRLYTSGWGLTDNTFNIRSKVKLEVDLPYVSARECQPLYRTININIWKGQICAGGEPGKDSCNGDSGGPLMYQNDRQFEVIGIVSFGPSPCGQKDIPSIYTNVYEYLPWIRNQIRP